MKTQTKTLTSLLTIGYFLLTNVAFARENVGGSGGHRNSNNNNQVMLANCSAGSNFQEIMLNNVRTRVLTDGDMWWDFTASVARYEVPKGSNSYAQFAGSLWFGGYENGNLRVAAMTYRQCGIDYWPGPINPADLSTDVATCQQYDKLWTFNEPDVANFYAYFQQYGAADPNTPQWIKEYPGNVDYGVYNVSVPNGTYSGGDVLPINYLAPYIDVNADGLYNYASGDYPAYHLSTPQNIANPVKRGQCVRYLFGDQTLFFVFNDVANKHGETGSTGPIGVEIRGQAFEFSTNDQLNDATFYNYEIINWSHNRLDSTYITIWDDCDLGDYIDDMIGCDVGRGLGYQYNGENYDYDMLGQTGYHDKLPAIGCDFFQGPYADVADSVDNDRDGCVDCSWSQCGNGSFTCTPAIPDNVLPEQCIMSRFTYYTNTSGINGNPNCQQPVGYYNYMKGLWLTGIPMTYGNSGLTPGTPCKFLFPGLSDPLGWGLGYKPSGYGAGSHPGSPIAPPGGTASYGTTGWTQTQGGLPMNDMRFLQSAGKFTMQPGSVNYVTYGIPFVRSTVADRFAAIPLLLSADDKAQSLFDNCFKVLDGPDAPDLTIQELDRQLLVTITNNPYTSNNYEARRYADFDPSIVLPTTPTGDKIYRFQGYIVYQLLDNTVSTADLTNATLARQVFQCDIKDGVKQIINYNSDPTLGSVPQLMVTGADAGIQNSFSITQDLFSSTSDNRLVNFRNYYYMAVAYAYNNYLTYIQNVPPTATSVYDTTTHAITTSFTDPKTGDYNGQQKPFLQGRNNVHYTTAIPHSPSPEAYGTVMNSAYGNGPAVTRIEGQGNGGYALDLMDQSISDILNPANNNRVQQITYVPGGTPILVKVVDPLRVVKGNFTVKLVAATQQASGSSITWYYDGSPPVADTTTLDTGRVKNIPTMKWFMTGTYIDASGNSVTKTWLSDEGLSVAQEKIITGLNNESLGFSVTIQQVSDPQQTAHAGTSSYIGQTTLAGDLLSSSMSGGSWLSAVKDIDGAAQDWILAGSNGLEAAPPYNYAPTDVNETFQLSGKAKQVFYADPGQVWESVVNGTWAPFRFVNSTSANNYNYPGLSISSTPASQIVSSYNNWSDTRLLSSVNIVFTSNQANWSRCPVIDMNTATDPHSGSITPLQYKWQLRRAPSVDINGHYYAPGTSPDYDSSMSWFPGYAINVETGERLNIIFSENSADTLNNGADMLWNPTNQVTKNITVGPVASPTLVPVGVFGGMHYIYVLGHNSDGNFTFTGLTGGNEVIPSDVRRYDAGKSVYQMLRGPSGWPRDYNAPIPTFTTTADVKAKQANKWCILAELFKDIMWTNIPLTNTPQNTGSGQGQQVSISGDVTVKIRVPKPFRYGLSTVTAPANTSYTASPTTNLFLPSGGETYTATPLNSNSAKYAPYDLVANPQNGNFPMYTFNTNSLAASTYQLGTAQSELAKINIVPNPYYAHDSYEADRITLEVKIINLPVKCTVKIYSLAGTLIRTLNKDNTDTYLTWDLHNGSNIQIASGLYILHIDAPGIGERIIKWFGVMRPYDLQSF
ncbi:MAG: hypothetical protein ACYDCN_09095 [Bacteroidia bacterium]